MEIRPIQPSDVEAVRLLLCANGWNRRVADVEQFRRLVANSQRTAVALEAGEVVGFVRALCDDVSNGYLSMLVVAAEHRGKGVGRALVRSIVDGNPNITWMARASREDSA
jgi:predicted N-acetyltransferase YhbS